MTDVVRAERLVKRFGDFAAVDDVTFRVDSGEVVGLLGANGAGKTTTIRMLIGLIAPTSGRAYLLGTGPDDRVRRRLGYVSQGLGLYRDLTVRENFDFVAGSYGVSGAVFPATLDRIADRLIGDVSLGEQRQVAFACALVHRPDVLVLDEPTSGVGPLESARLWDRLRGEAGRGAGVLVSTHSMEEARQCDRLVLMADGRIVATGSESDIVGGTRSVVVRSHSWKGAFDALVGSGMLAMLAGRDVRIADAEVDAVRAVLDRAGIEAEVTSAPATIDERMVIVDGR